LFQWRSGSEAIDLYGRGEIRAVFVVKRKPRDSRVVQKRLTGEMKKNKELRKNKKENL